ncbi:precorrin-6A reductase [Bariatricus massiliensis]|uniref:precorrin-6A reductase n=1 Tax=Bariatricus massiliensis TaxID=1745713 RepID=UPI0009EECB60|nr:precorrin-6A reductase [Bariatricus massiliensis]MDY2663008.1 precorrin-6A reductase [Bariatricus massiliensis]
MDKTIIIISFTESGSRLNETLCRKLAGGGNACEGYCIERLAEKHGLLKLPEDVSTWIGSLWGRAAFLFIGAAGIAVRYTAPWVRDKFTDSPVVVMDEKGSFAIPLLSGHVGGAVEIARKAAECTGAVPVITTATDVQEKFAVDVFATKNGLTISDRKIAREISASILDGSEVGIFFHEEEPFRDLKEQFLTWGAEGVYICSSLKELEHYVYGIAVADYHTARALQEKGGTRRILFLWKEGENTLASDELPQSPSGIVVGIGCRRGAKKELLEAGLWKVLEANGAGIKDVAAFASIDLKRDEAGILELVDKYGIPFYTYSAEELQAVKEVSSRSKFVRQTVGVDNVCERAARLACPRGRLIQPKLCTEGAAFALVKKCLRILIFAGTTEGRLVSEKLAGLPVDIWVSTATEYGKECILSGASPEAIHVTAGRMDEQAIESFIREQDIHLVVDATHPYACEVTKNISAACTACGTAYLRCLREQGGIGGKARERMVWKKSVGEAVEYLKATEGNIFLSTGSKELRRYTEIPDYRERCYARVLSTKEAVEASVALGFQGAHLIAMQGPFSKEMNTLMLRETKAKYFVTKESGKAGGFLEKAEAANATGAVLVVIGRPEETGMSVDGTVEYIKGLL